MEKEILVHTSSITGAMIACGVALWIGIQVPDYTGHSAHDPLPIPSEWTDSEFAAFVAESDRQIDQIAGRTVAPGEVVEHQGLRFGKSIPGFERISCDKWCPLRKICHPPPK